jgi:hypothetical protein
MIVAARNGPFPVNVATRAVWVLLRSSRETVLFLNEQRKLSTAGTAAFSRADAAFRPRPTVTSLMRQAVIRGKRLARSG